MKRFLVNVFFFTFILLLFNLFFIYVLELYYFKKYEAVDLNYNTYLLSDSHGERLGNNLEKYGVFNFSARSDSYHDMLRKTNYLIENSNIKKLYITCDDHVLSKYREKSNNLDRSAQFSKDIEFDNYFSFIKDKYLSRYIVFFNSKGSSLLKEYFKSFLFSRVKDKPVDKTTWHSLSKEGRFNKAKERAITQFPDTNTSDTLTTSLQRILLLCKKNKIEVIGVKFPLSDDYYNLLTPIIKNQTQSAEIIFLKNNLKVLDFTTVFLNNDNFFYDQDHLNSLGSKAFCDIFYDKAAL